jgi:hypothetical protein
MNKNLELVTNLLKNLLNQPARDVKLGHGSFITLGFGKDLQTEIITRGKKEIDIRPEWYLWVYMCFWELETADQLLATHDDDRKIIQESLKRLENKKLLRFEILNDIYDMKLEFEEDITLSLFFNDSNEDNVQWMLFTPDEMVLKIGPGQKLSYHSES